MYTFNIVNYEYENTAATQIGGFFLSFIGEGGGGPK